MAREFRLFLYFLIGVLLSAIACFSYAETVSPTWGAWSPADPATGCSADFSSAGISQYGWTPLDISYSYTSTGQKAICRAKCTGTACGSQMGVVGPYGRTYTRTSSCASGFTWDAASGMCSRSNCPVSSTQGWYKNAVGVDISGTYCVDKCTYHLSWALFDNNTVYETSQYHWKYYSWSSDGATCTVNSTDVPTPAPGDPAVPIDPAPCDPGQGVISNDSGKVLCVDKGKVPEADTPIVKKETTTKKESDGSTTTITTVETCTGTGACSTTTTTTIGAKPNGEAGTAGTPGTSVSETDKKASTDTSDFCKANPNVEICKGGLATEVTAKQSLEEIKKLTKSEELSDEAITGKATFNSGDDAALKAQNEDLIARVSGNVVPEGVQSNKGAWEAAMLSGWFEEIPNTGCSPAVISAGGRSITLDWCDRASQISQMGAYALWFTLLVGVFVMLTGGKRGD